MMMPTHEVKPHINHVYAVDKHRPMCVEVFAIIQLVLFGILQSLLCHFICSFPLKRFFFTTSTKLV